MMKRTRFSRGLLVSAMIVAVGISACSSDDDDDDGLTNPPVAGTDGADPGDTNGTDGTDGTDGTSELNDDIVSLALTLDPESTVPPANAPDASGTGDVTVDTSTGAISGSVTVEGTTGVPFATHVHMGAAGTAGPILITMIGSENNTVWTIPDGSALDAVGIEAFNDGELYINVHTDANPDGELRAQLVPSEEPAPGSVTISFRNLSDSQLLTPPVVALHNAPDADNGIRFFEVGTPVSGEVRQVAEDGNIMPLNGVVQGQIAAGTVSAGGPAFPDPDAPGPLMPGDTASITLMPELPDQVMSIVTMVICTNDGITGVDSMEIEDGTFIAPVYDVGSENNVLLLNYWVAPCTPGGETENLHEDENGVITEHPGQSGSENPIFDFEAGAEIMEVTVTTN